MIVFTMLPFLVPAWPGYAIILRDCLSNLSRSAETIKAIGMLEVAPLNVKDLLSATNFKVCDILCWHL
jgi:hypothetical protein